MCECNKTTPGCHGTVTVVCGGSVPGSTDGNGKPPPSEEPGDQDQPEQPVEPPCRVATVRFQSVTIDDAGINHPTGIFDEDWALSFMANGQVVNMPHRQVPTGAIIALGLEVDADLASPSATIQVSSSGQHLSGGIVIDQLPTASVTLGAAENWGFGSVLSLSASNSDRGYTVTYSIRCRTERRAVTSLISREQAVSIIRRELESVMDAKSIPEEAALSLFVQRTESWGFRLKEVQSDLLVWEGRRDLASILARVESTPSRTRSEKAL
jgi:hypothetical protein